MSDSEDRSPAATSRGDVSVRLRRWGLRALQIALTVLVTWFIVDRVGVTLDDVTALDDRWIRPGWGLLGSASGLLLGGFVASAALWGRMVRELGGPSLPIPRAASIYFTSNLGRYVPGKIWQLAGVAYLARRAGVTAPLATASAVLVQAVSLAGAALVGAWALIATPGVASGWGKWIVAGVVLAVAVAMMPPVFRRMMGIWFRLAGTDDPGLRPESSFGPRWVLLFACNWIVYGAAFWLMAASFGVQGSPLALGTAFAAAYVLGYAMVFAPAGIGVREGFLIAFLQPVTGSGAATATAILARFWMTVLELVPALGFAGWTMLRGERRRGDGG